MESKLCLPLFPFLSLSLDMVQCVKPFEARLEQASCSLPIDSVSIDCS